MNVLRMIKLMGWERKVNEQIAGKRWDELNWMWKTKLCGLFISYFKYVSVWVTVMSSQPFFSSLIIPLATMIATFAAHTLIFRRELKGEDMCHYASPQFTLVSASAVFTSIAVFEALHITIRQVINSMPNVIQGRSLLLFICHRTHILV
jgi:hypothetical protein